MKKLLLFIITGTLLTSCASTKILVNFDEAVVKIYDVKGTKDELFVNANRWMVSVFKDARSVIQFSDKTEGVLIGKYLLYYPKSLYDICPEIYAIIEINVKDDKGGISVKPYNWGYVKANSGIPYWTGTQDEHLYSKEKAIADIDALCEDFNKSLQAEKAIF